MLIPSSAAPIYDELKWWGTVLGVAWTAFKAFNWVKDMREKDIKGIGDGVSGLKTEIKEQTTQFMSAMNDNTKEIRDLRTVLTQALIAPMPIAKAARARRKKDMK